jgi:chromosomal replication initiator protein
MTRSEGHSWQSVLELVRSVDSDPAFQELILTLQPQALEDHRLDVRSSATLSAPERDRLRGVLAEAAREVWGRDVVVDVLPDLPATEGPGQLPLPFTRRAETAPHEQLRLNPSYIFDNFVVAPSNRLANAACVAVCEAPGKAYNPLFLHGTVGLGKSHLLQAICHRLLQRNPDAKILYLSCESFVNQFIVAVERGDLETFRYRYRHLDVLVIDDVHFLADKERTQEEFFHTFNTLYQSQGQVILSSDSPPHEIPHLEERLVSRFKWGLVARIDRPGFETRVAIITKKARLRGLDLPDDVTRYIARTIDTNVRELEGAVTRVIAQTMLTGAEISLEMVTEVLADAVPRKPRATTVPQIMEAVTWHYSLRVAELQGKKRNQSIALPRQVCMYLARELTKLSLEEIGGYFGGRDHTTVLHACRKIGDNLKVDADLRATVDRLVQRLHTGPPTQAGSDGTADST